MEPMIGAAQSVPGGLVKDVNEANFHADVLEASLQTPVIVDFWAPWCGPCKQLGPIIENAVRDAGGAVTLAKVNIDANQRIAQEMRIQSIPAVYAFWQGRPIDGFVGALPESQIRSFIDRVVRAGGGQPGPSPIEEALEQAAEALEAGDPAHAAAIYGEVLKHRPDNIKAIAGLAKAYIATGQPNMARELVEQLPTDKKEDADIRGVVATLDLAEKAAESAGRLGELEAQLAADAGDHQARYDLALALFATGQAEAAVEHLLEIMRRDRGWNEEAARKQLIEVFDALGPTNPLVAASRRKMSSLLFS